MRRSIRWSLIGWFGLLLAAVLIGFGGVLYTKARQDAEAGIQSRLEGQAAAILGALEWDEEDGWEVELSDDYLRGLTAGFSS